VTGSPAFLWSLPAFGDGNIVSDGRTDINLARARKLAEDSGDPLRIMLVVPSDPQFDHPGSILYFDCQDIDAECATLDRLGVEVLRAPFVAHREDDHEFWLAFFRDTEGNTLGLTQWRRGPR